MSVRESKQCLTYEKVKLAEQIEQFAFAVHDRQRRNVAVDEFVECVQQTRIWSKSFNVVVRSDAQIADTSVEEAGRRQIRVLNRFKSEKMIKLRVSSASVRGKER
jgi:hypothetical protein